MTIERLVERMRIRCGDRRIFAKLENGKVTFSGGQYGEHSVLANDPKRIIEHWKGYLKNNGMLPEVGGLVFFQCGIPRVERVKAVRSNGLAVKVEIRYKNGNVGKPRWIEVSALR